MDNKGPENAAIAAASAALYMLETKKNKYVITRLRKEKSEKEGMSLWKRTGLIELMRRSEFFENKI